MWTVAEACSLAIAAASRARRIEAEAEVLSRHLTDPELGQGLNEGGTTEGSDTNKHAQSEGFELFAGTAAGTLDRDSLSLTDLAV